MHSNSANVDLAGTIEQHLPFLRRYARALTGSQGSGDRFAAATLEAVLEDRSAFEAASGPKVALFQTFHLIWASAGAPVADDESGPASRAHQHLAKLTERTREALLLFTIEEFTISEIAEIMNTRTDDVEHLLSVAREEMQNTISGKVMIIEDEPIIAMDLEGIVSDMGHSITGNARTRKEAQVLGTTKRPDLILADIQLADNSSGIDAVHDLLAELGDVPVIFITAFPERLLTGERPEPTFLIAKPYTVEQVRSAVSQAMFFASTETLKQA
ncbi:response regulator [Falsihalocynthiibacter sp. SS001]|uniref:response regulator n=1 Tax=Falsihalocynthiibacter sp. SS001 TaxID=3349698 RepID=UPI0036D35DAE